MKKRTTILISLACLLLYASIFIANLASDLHKNNNQYFLDLKINCQNIMLEIYGDIELSFNKAKDLSKDEKKDLDSKLNKILDNYYRILKTKNHKDLAQFFYNFCYHAELLEAKLNKEIPYSTINEKYQSYIGNFYAELEYVKEMTK
jgi:hypothetical protein